ncbi:MAG: P1 family peptidase [Rhodospirillaceae bacterium]|nr:P1 family peptidase [Rhodospirillaceae bacterium]
MTDDLVRPGPRNSLTDVAGLEVGQSHDADFGSGVSVVLCPDRAVCAVAAAGGAPGTRDTDALRPENLVDAVDAVVLSGGSVFGLASADAVTRWLAARGRGLAFGGMTVPLAPAAVLFDLPDSRAAVAPEHYTDLARAACDSAGAAVAEGSVGAGYGARAGTLRGGVGTASAVHAASGAAVAALAAVNSLGEVVMPDGLCFWAWPWEQAGEYGAVAPVADPTHRTLSLPQSARAGGQGHTVIAVVATDVALSQADALRLATMAQDGLARAIRPVHTLFDGDVVFALATGKRPLDGARPQAISRLGAMAADCLARAVARGVFRAAPGGPCESWRERRDRLAAAAASSS